VRRKGEALLGGEGGTGGQRLLLWVEPSEEDVFHLGPKRGELPRPKEKTERIGERTRKDARDEKREGQTRFRQKKIEAFGRRRKEGKGRPPGKELSPCCLLEEEGRRSYKEEKELRP